MIFDCKPGVRVPTLPGFSGKSHYLFNFINMKKFTLYSKDNHIHAVSDEPIGELQWYFDTVTGNIYRSSHRPVTMACFKKIEITTDTLENQIDCPDGMIGCEVLHLQNIPSFDEKLLLAIRSMFNIYGEFPSMYFLNQNYYLGNEKII